MLSEVLWRAQKSIVFDTKRYDNPSTKLNTIGTLCALFWLNGHKSEFTHIRDDLFIGTGLYQVFGK